jgi:hypothetical protein
MTWQYYTLCLSDANAELSNEATNAIPQNQREFKQKFF